MQAFSLVIRSPLCRRLNLSLHDFWADESIFEKERTRKSSGPLFGSLNRWFSASKSATFCWGCPLQKVKGELSASLNTALAFSMGFLFWGFDLLPPPAVHRSTQKAATACSLLLPQSLCVLQMVVSIFNCILILINRPCNRRCPSQADDDADNANNANDKD